MGEGVCIYSMALEMSSSEGMYIFNRSDMLRIALSVCFFCFGTPKICILLALSFFTISKYVGSGGHMSMQ